jgi:hypothetical protein
MTVQIPFQLSLDESYIDTLAGILGGGSPQKIATTDLIFALISALTIAPVNGILKGDGVAFGVASAGADYAPGTASLPTGLLKNTALTGALQIASAGADYYAPGGADISVADGGSGASNAPDACKNFGVPYILDHSAVSISCPNDLLEHALKTITIPAHAIGANGFLVLKTMWSWTNSANIKTAKIKLGGMSGAEFMNIAVTTSSTFQTQTHIYNAGAENAQKGWLKNSPICFTTAGSAMASGAIDTAVSQDLVITGQKASASESLTLEQYTVIVFPKA